MRIAILLSLLLCPSAFAADDALAYVNAARAQRGLRPYVRDPGLAAGASACADYRAARGIAGHTRGGMGDFRFLPAGANARTGGCGAAFSTWRWASCCTYDNYTYAGAA